MGVFYIAIKGKTKQECLSTLYQVCNLGHKHQISPDIYDVQAMVRDKNKIRLLRNTA